MLATLFIKLDKGFCQSSKPSTGKTPTSATPAAARQLFEIASVASRPIGVKISGGVRTLDDAMTYVEIAEEFLGTDQVTATTMRIGASSLLGAVLDSLSSSAS